MGTDSLYINSENLQPRDIKGGFRNHLITHFRRLQFSKYRYDNVPDGIRPYYIERGLFDKGIIGLVKNDKSADDSYYALALTGVQKINFNNEIVESHLTGYQTYGGILFPNVRDDETGIFMKNTINNDTTYELLVDHINKLVDIWYSDNINLLLSNKKLVGFGKPEHFNQIINEQMAKLEVSPFIIIDKDRTGYEKWQETDINRELLNYNVTYEPTKYSGHYMEVYSRCLDILGIPHNASQKKERNVTDEVVLDSVETDLINEEMFYFREDGVKRFNELYGTNMTVTDVYKEKQEKDKADMMKMSESEGDNDE